MQHVYPTDKFKAHFIHDDCGWPFIVGECVSHVVTDTYGTVFHFEGRNAVVIEIETSHKSHVDSRGYWKAYSDTNVTYQIYDKLNTEIYPKKDNNILLTIFGTALRDIDKLKTDVKALKRAKPKRTYKKRKR